jgi:glycosyltransferase involved in cell wall biosynthesis
MLELPKVSVITPFHSEPLDMLKANLLSVKQQVTDYEVEHIVICDNPNRDYEEVKKLVESFGAIVLFPKKNLGLPMARNYGIDNSSGNFIMLLDADDRFVRNKVQMQIQFMLDNNLDHCYGGYREWHWGADEFNKDAGAIIPPIDDCSAYLTFLNNVCYCGSNCFKRKIYDEIGGFDEKLTGLGAEDMEYWLRISLNGYKSQCLPKVLYYLGVHSENMTAKYMAGGQFAEADKYIKQKHNL